MNTHLLNTKTLQSTLLCAGTAALLLAPVSSNGQSSDALIDKLVEKGILTVKEANQLREESDKGFTAAYAAKSGMSDWVSALKFNGDFRGRYEGFYRDDSSFVDRNRFRYRLRFGVTANMAENFEVGMRLASGDATASGGLIDPISANQTFDNNGANKGIYIDAAYAKWSPVNTPEWSGSLTFGKMDNPFVFSEMVFDSDYTPEGLASQWTYNLSPEQALKFHVGGFVLDEIGSSSRDPFLLGAQARWDAAWNQHLSSSIGLAGLVISGKDGLNGGTATSSSPVPDINVGNTRGPGGQLLNHFNPVIADAALVYMLESFPYYTGALPIRAGGEFMHNPGASDNNNAYAFGLTFGKAGKRKTWEVGYRWKVLESDAWYEELVDSDSGAFYASSFPNSNQRSGYRSGTNIRGHTFKAAYSPYDFLTLAATYYLFEAINEVPSGSGSSIGRLQLDASLKF